MGLDFVVLERDDDDDPEQWPGTQLDTRRADDPADFVQAKLRRVYDSRFSPAGLAASAEFSGWPGPPRPPGIVGFFFWPLSLLIVWPALLFHAWREKRRDAARIIPSYDDWRNELLSQDPPQVVIPFGPNCPPGGKPFCPAIVQWYGYRGRVLEPRHNELAAWWAKRNGVDLDVLLYNGEYLDGPPSIERGADIVEDAGATIGDVAVVFRDMARDCEEAFPEIVAAADEQPRGDDAIGPFPDRGLDVQTIPFTLSAIRGAATFFAFWQGRGYKIAADF